MKEWVKMPSKVFMDSCSSPLMDMRWVGDGKSDYIAALMVYIVLLHHVNDAQSIAFGNAGECSLSYEKLCELTSISRTKIAKGLSVLEKKHLVERVKVGKINVYTINNYSNRGGWAKLPAKGLYSKDKLKVKAFDSFKLRAKDELNALKIYLVLASFRDNETNYTQLSYEKISEYTNVQRNDIRSALSLLVANKLIQVDSLSTDRNEFSTSNVYRLCNLEVYKHRGTRSE